MTEKDKYLRSDGYEVIDEYYLSFQYLIMFLVSFLVLYWLYFNVVQAKFDDKKEERISEAVVVNNSEFSVYKVDDLFTII